MNDIERKMQAGVLPDYTMDYEEDLPGEFTEQYIILECLNHTEMCDTLLVVHKEENWKAVAKCYPKSGMLYDNTDLDEIKQISNRSIPEFITEYKNEDYQVILREYVEGVSLEEYVQAYSMDEEQILNLAVRLAETMRSIHISSPVVIHRDIKPQNIIITEDDQVVLIDFGISRIYKDGVKSDTIIGGTAGYAAPEQYGFMQSDIRSDIYSYGMVLTYLLTGLTEPLEEARTPMEQIAKKCTEFAPDRRYQNDDALLLDLDRLKNTGDNCSHKNKKFIWIAAVILMCVLGASIGLIVRAHNTGSYQFYDPMVEKAVRAELNKPTGAITDEDLKQVTELYMIVDEIYTNDTDYYQGLSDYFSGTISGTGTVTDLRDLKYMPNLSVVRLDAQPIQDVTPLRDLNQLEHISFRNCQIQDISALSDKEYLIYLCLNGNELTDIESLASCSSLMSLDLNCAGSFDGMPLSGLNRLEILDISGANTDGYKYLQGKSFNELKVGTPGQRDVSFIKDISNVRDFYIWYSDITDISALSGRSDIQYLNLWGTHVDDLTPLFSMSDLRQVDLDSYYREEMDRLIQEMGDPSFEIVYME